MKISMIGLATCFALIATASHAQTGQGSTTGDPAASSQNAKKENMAPTKSGTGTSTSGGKDGNGDQGRDKMPESNMNVKQRSDKPNIPNPGSK